MINNKFINNMNNTANVQQPQNLISPPNKKTKPPVSKKWLLIGFGVGILFLVYFVMNFNDLRHGPNQNNSNSIITSNQEEKTQIAKIYKLEEIFTPEEKIISSQIAPNNIYAFAITRKLVPIQHILKENENGPIIEVRDNLIFVNLITKEKKEFDLYNLASKEIIDLLKTIPVPVQFTFHADLLSWSADSNNFWGAINLVLGADPPVNGFISLFKINTQNWTIERFALPEGYINSLGQQNLNLDKNLVLFELVTPENELYLYSYNILTKDKTIVVSYPNSIFSKYLPGEYGFLGYFYPEFLETESRQLNAKWLDKDTISYTDFVTRQEVIKKIK